MITNTEGCDKHSGSSISKSEVNIFIKMIRKSPYKLQLIKSKSLYVHVCMCRWKLGCAFYKLHSQREKNGQY